MRKWAFFPVLIAVHPILMVFAGSGKWQPLEDYFRFAIISLALVLLAWLCLTAIINHAGRAAFAVSTLWFLLFAYATVSAKLFPYGFWPTAGVVMAIIGITVAGLGRSRKQRTGWLSAILIVGALAAIVFLVKPFVSTNSILAALWLFATILAAWWAGSIRSIETLTPYLNIAAVGLVALPAYALYTTCQQATHQIALLKSPELQTGFGRLTPQPDVYQFILDGYGRADALNRGFALDNKPFVKALESRGFFVAKNSRSNYAQTEQSLASELNAAYLDKLVPKIDKQSTTRSLFTPLIRDNAVARAMRAKGYDYITISTGFSSFNRDSSREDLSDPSGLSLAEQLMIDQTPEAGFGFLTKTLNQIHRDRVNHAFDAALAAPRTGKPRYILVHVLSPHPPFLFDRDGKPVEPGRLFGIWDADLFVDKVGTKAEYTLQYPQQLQYINKRLIQTIDQIAKESKTRPVIILQGDHGARRDHSMKSLDDTDPSQSYENLIAVLGPSSVRKNMYDGISNVNILRAVLAGLFQTKFEKLPDRSYYSTWAHPYEYVDVTANLKPKA